MTKAKSQNVIPIERIARHIYLIRALKVMLDSDLAELYGVTIGRLNEQVSRNRDRFPDDFMFRLTQEEYDALRSQIATLKRGRGQHRKYLPRVFTEQGVAMLSSVLRSKQAVQVNIGIMRAFVRLREMLAGNEELARRVELIDRKVSVLWQKFEAFINPPEDPKKKHPIGFIHPKDDV